MRPNAVSVVLCAAVCLAPTAFAQAPANDDCVNATPVFDGINPAPPVGITGFTFSNVGATESPGAASCLAANPGTSDVWFLYQATSTGPCVFQTCTPAGFANGTLGDTLLEVYDVCGGVRLGCDDDACFVQALGSASAVAVTAGVTYLVRVSAWSTTNTVEGTFYLTVAPTPAVAPGDDCATTSALILGDGVYAGTTVGATPTSPSPTTSCLTGVGPGDLDVWFYYLPPASGVLSVFREGADPTATNGGDVAGASSVEMHDISAACFSNPTLLICAANPGAALTATVVAGNVYALRFGVAAGAAQGVFTVTLSLAAAPTHDDCANALPVVDGVNPATGAYTNATATDAAGFAAACAGGAAGSKDLFFDYVATSTGAAVATTCDPIGAIPGTLADTVLEVYAAGCAGPAIACGDDDPSCGTRSSVSFATVAGAHYVLRVAAKSASATGTFYLSINPAPGNDDCASATPLPLGANGPFFHLGATTSATPAPSCAASQSDLWFAVVAPFAGTLEASTCGTNFNATLAVYAACGGAEVACDDDDAQNRGPCATTQTSQAYVRFAATAGATYFFRLGGATSTLFGTSYLNVNYRFSFVVQPNQPASNVALSNVAGVPGGFAVNVVTVVPGAFPNGWFYGVDIPWLDLFALVNYGPPFFAPLDGSGASAATLPLPSYPLGVTIYCVGIDLGVGGAPVGRTDPFQLTF